MNKCIQKLISQIDDILVVLAMNMKKQQKYPKKQMHHKHRKVHEIICNTDSSCMKVIAEDFRKAKEKVLYCKSEGIPYLYL